MRSLPMPSTSSLLSLPLIVPLRVVLSCKNFLNFLCLHSLAKSPSFPQLKQVTRHLTILCCSLTSFLSDVFPPLVFMSIDGLAYGCLLVRLRSRLTVTLPDCWSWYSSTYSIISSTVLGLRRMMCCLSSPGNC